MGITMQKSQVREMAKTVAEGIIEDINKGKIPPEWDMVEMRALMVKRLTELETRPLSGPRLKKYAELCAANQL